jgi:hypothetical protein
MLTKVLMLVMSGAAIQHISAGQVAATQRHGPQLGSHERLIAQPPQSC